MANLNNHLSLLLTTTLLLSFSSSATPLRCPNCGTTPVPYPLSTFNNCGDPSYKIRCDPSSNTLQFETINNSYPISSIHPQTQRLIIRPASFLRNSCITTDQPSQGIQLKNSLPFNVTDSNTIIFLNCTDRILSSPLNCSATSICHAYIKQMTEAEPCRRTEICCDYQAGGSTTSYWVRVSGPGCNGYRSFVNLDPSLPVGRWPEVAGVEIQWASPREPVCGVQADCEAGTNATCMADPMADGVRRRCFCNSGLRWDPIAGKCAESELIEF